MLSTNRKNGTFCITSQFEWELMNWNWAVRNATDSFDSSDNNILIIITEKYYLYTSMLLSPLSSGFSLLVLNGS